MADHPLSLTASVTAAARSASSSLTTLQELITSFSDNAPQELHELGAQLRILQNLLQALQQQQPPKGVPNAELSANQKACFENLTPALEACKQKCDTFTSKLSKMISSHSQAAAGKANWRDRAAEPHFNIANDIALLKSDLKNYAQTINAALGVARVPTNENEDERVWKCYLDSSSSCTSTGLKMTPTSARAAGTHVKYARTFNEARQVIGNMGDVVTRGGGGVPAVVVVDYAEARDRSVQHVGNMDGEVAKAFWTRE